MNNDKWTVDGGNEETDDYEYPLHGMNVMNDWIEVKVDISVEEPALKGAEVFQNRLKRAGITTELAYVGTFGRQ